MSKNVFNDPNYSRLLEIWQATEVPEFVKEAQIVENQQFNELPVDTFGDPGKRLYPLNNKSNTWLSREYFKKDRPQYPEKTASLIEGRINKAAAFWRLDEPSYIRHDSQPEAYMINITDGAEKVVFDVNMRNPRHFKTAAETLYNNKSKYTYPMRRSFARGLLAAPAELHAELDEPVSEYIQKAANFGSSTKHDVIQALYKRICWTRRNSPEVSNALVKIAHEFQKDDGALPIAQLHKVAEAIDVVDRGTGLHRLYGQKLMTPEEALFRVTEKVACDLQEETVGLMNGSLLSRTGLRKKADKIDEFFEKHVGDIPYKDENEMVTIITTLPRTDADALQNYLGE